MAKSERLAKFSEVARLRLGRPEADLLRKSGWGSPPRGNKALKYEHAELGLSSFAACLMRALNAIQVQAHYARVHGSPRLEEPARITRSKN